MKKPNNLHEWIDFACMAEDHNIEWLCKFYNKKYQTIVNWKVELINRSITDFWEPGEYKLEEKIKQFKARNKKTPIEYYGENKIAGATLTIRTRGGTEITIG